jgi:ankyrin repeat protein
MHFHLFVGFDEIGRLLLTGGAIVDISSSEETLLHAAASFGKIGIMQILLEHHADVMTKLTISLPFFM